MDRKIIKGVEVWSGSANVHADLELPDAEELRIRTDLVIRIRRTILCLGLAQQAAAKRMGIQDPEMARMMRGDFADLTQCRLIECLARLEL
ncbi:MAG: helix-turn-helix domain-containing protein [Alphaproteobacteria bacterium]|nr:helix-turn-helix domain-containing protein [Alphaproteobacteria bacterium]